MLRPGRSDPATDNTRGEHAGSRGNVSRPGRNGMKTLAVVRAIVFAVLLVYSLYSMPWAYSGAPEGGREPRARRRGRGRQVTRGGSLAGRGLDRRRRVPELRTPPQGRGRDRARAGAGEVAGPYRHGRRPEVAFLPPPLPAQAARGGRLVRPRLPVAPHWHRVLRLRPPPRRLRRLVAPREQGHRLSLVAQSAPGLLCRAGPGPRGRPARVAVAPGNLGRSLRRRPVRRPGRRGDAHGPSRHRRDHPGRGGGAAPRQTPAEPPGRLPPRQPYRPPAATAR